MWDITYCIDASLSMGGSIPSKGGGASSKKIEAVARALLSTLSSTDLIPKRGSRVAILSYHAETKGLGIMLDKDKKPVEIIEPLTPIEELRSPQRMAELRKKLASLKTSGGTPAGAAIQTGLELLSAGKEENARRRFRKIVLVTDEYSDSGPDPESVTSDEVILDVVGIRNSAVQKRWEKLVSKTGGVFVHVDSEEDLTRCLDPRIPKFENSKEYTSAREALLLFNQATTKEKAASDDPISAQKASSRIRDARTNLSKELLKLALRRESLSQEIQRLTAANGPMASYAKKVWPMIYELDSISDIETDINKILKS